MSHHHDVSGVFPVPLWSALPQPFAIRAAILISVGGTLLLWIIWPTTQVLSNRVAPAAQLEPPSASGAPTAAAAVAPAPTTAAQASR